MTPRLPDPPATPLELFLALVAIASPTGVEGAKADAIEAWLTCCGLSCERDDAARLTGSDTGNLIARRWVSKDRPTLLFVAHLDTVQAVGEEISPVLGSDGVVRSAGDTILGADNQAAVAAVMSVLARPALEHANVVAVFSTGEERGRMGVTALGPLVEEVDLALPVDGSYPVGTVLESALGQTPFTLTVHGRRAHAAKDPAAGIHAVAAAAEIVAGLALGWDGDTSVLNVGRIDGGSETNLVPDLARVVGEVRGFSGAAMAERLQVVRGVAEAVAARRGVRWELVEDVEAGAPPFPAGDAPGGLDVLERACAAVGVPMRREICLATLEANFLHGMGMGTLGIASGGRGPHSVDESLEVAELERLVALLDAVLRAA